MPKLTDSSILSPLYWRAAMLFLEERQSHAAIGATLHVSRRTACRYVHLGLKELGLAWRKNLPSVPIDSSLIRTTSKGRRADGRILAKVCPEQFAMVVASFSPVQRQIYHDYFVSGYNAREIAEMDRVSRSAVTRCIIRIRKIFERAGLPPPTHIAEGRRHDGPRPHVRCISLSYLNSDTY